MRLNEAREPSCERSEGGSPKRNPEGDVGDLCRKLHKGLAHLGKLGGNIFLGFCLGAAGPIGVIFGLPIDIRHVAFSSADVGYAMSVFIPGASDFALFTLFALLIGGVNLIVSFTLALNVALRARNTRISSFPKLIKAWFQVVTENPMALIYPPRDPLPEPDDLNEAQPDSPQTKAENKEQRQKALQK